MSATSIDPVYLDVLTLLAAFVMAGLTLRWQRAPESRSRRIHVLLVAGVFTILLFVRLNMGAGPGSGRSIWWSPGFHLLLWLVILFVLPVLGAWLLERSKRGALLFLGRAGGPLLVGLVWLYGVFFDPPNNWATMDRLGFWGFWLELHRLKRLGDNLALVLGLCLPGLVVLAWAFARIKKTGFSTSRAAESSALAPHSKRGYPGSRTRMILAYLFYVGAAFSLRPIPDQIMDVANHMSYMFDDLDRLIPALGPVVVVCALAAGIFLVLAGFLSRPARSSADLAAHETRSRWVRIRNLPGDLDEDGLRQRIERHGSLRSLEMKPGTAVVEMKDPRHARWLLEELSTEDLGEAVEAESFEP